MSRIHARTSLVLAVIAVAVVAVTLPSGAGSVSPTPVLTTPDIWEDFPAYGSDGLNTLFAWTRNSKAKPNAFNAFLVNLAIKGADPIRVNPSNTRGYTGAVENGRLLWQQVKRGQSDLRLYDYSDSENVAPPAGINNGDWQWHPSVDGDTYLYGENRFNSPDAPWKVILATDTDGNIDKIILDKAKNRCKCIWPGQVVGDYATWTKCTTTCQVWIYEISSDTTTRVSNDPVRQPVLRGSRYQRRRIPGSWRQRLRRERGPRLVRLPIQRARTDHRAGRRQGRDGPDGGAGHDVDDLLWRAPGAPRTRRQTSSRSRRSPRRASPPGARGVPEAVEFERRFRSAQCPRSAAQGVVLGSQDGRDASKASIASTLRNVSPMSSSPSVMRHARVVVDVEGLLRTRSGDAPVVAGRS